MLDQQPCHWVALNLCSACSMVLLVTSDQDLFFRISDLKLQVGDLRDLIHNTRKWTPGQLSQWYQNVEVIRGELLLLQEAIIKNITEANEKVPDLRLPMALRASLQKIDV